MAMVKPRPAAPRRPRPPRESPAERARRRRANTRLAYDIAGIGLITAALVLLATLVWPSRSDENVFGTAVVAGLRLIVGAGAWAFPCVLLLCGMMLAVGRERSWDNIGGASVLFLVFVTWWHLGHVGPAGSGRGQPARLRRLRRRAPFVRAARGGGHGGRPYRACGADRGRAPVADRRPASRRARAGRAASGARRPCGKTRRRRGRTAHGAGTRLHAPRGNGIPRRTARPNTDDVRSGRSRPTLFRRPTPEPDAEDTAAVGARGTDDPAEMPVRKVDALAAVDAALRPPPPPPARRAAAAPERFPR
jgi:hypothetical protein